MLTKEMCVNATHGTIFYHVKLRNADGTPLRARVNGKCRTWITRANDYALPMKHGLKQCFHITQGNSMEWAINETAAVVEAP